MQTSKNTVNNVNYVNSKITFSTTKICINNKGPRLLLAETIITNFKKSAQRKKIIYWQWETRQKGREIFENVKCNKFNNNIKFWLKIETYQNVTETKQFIVLGFP